MHFLKQLYRHFIRVIGHQDYLTSQFVEDVARVTYHSSEIKEKEWQSLYERNKDYNFLALLMKTKETPKSIVNNILGEIWEEKIKISKPYYPDHDIILFEAIKRNDLDAQQCNKLCKMLNETAFSGKIYNHFTYQNFDTFNEDICSEKFADYFIEKFIPIFLSRKDSNSYLICAFSKNEDILKPFLEYKDENIKVAFAIANNPFISDGIRNAAYEIQEKDPITQFENRTDFVKDICCDILLNTIRSKCIDNVSEIRILSNIVNEDSISDNQALKIFDLLNETSKHLSKTSGSSSFDSHSKDIALKIAKNTSSEKVLRKCYDFMETLFKTFNLHPPIEILCLPTFPQDLVEKQLNAFLDILGKDPLAVGGYPAVPYVIKTIADNLNQINTTDEFKSNFLNKLLEEESLTINTALSLSKSAPIETLDKIIDTQTELMPRDMIYKIDTSGNPYNFSLPYDFAKINKAFRDIESFNVADEFHNFFENTKNNRAYIEREALFLPPLRSKEECEKFKSRAKDFRTNLTIRKIRDSFDTFKSKILIKSYKHIDMMETGLMSYNEDSDTYDYIKPEDARKIDRENCVDILRKMPDKELLALLEFFKNTNPRTVKFNDEFVLQNPIDIALKVEGYSVLCDALEEILIKRSLIKTNSKSKSQKYDLSDNGR